MEKTPQQYNKDLNRQLIILVSQSNGSVSDALDSIRAYFYETLIRECPDKKEFYIEAAKNLDSSDD